MSKIFKTLDRNIRKIIYISFNDPYSTPGVYKKELNFCNIFGKICEEYGIKFEGFNIALIKGQNNIKGNNYLQIVNVKKYMDDIIRNKVINYALRNYYSIKEAYNIVKTHKPDVILLRYYSTRLVFPFNPKKYNMGSLLISEHQTKEIEEMKSNFIDKLFIPIEIIKARLFFKNVDGIVGVTKEIAEYEVKRARKNIPYLVLTNGINVDDYPLKKYSSYNGKELNMLLVSSVINKWIGIDRILKGLYNYKGATDIKLHIVGEVKEDILKIIDYLGLKEKVVMYGLKFGKELDKIYDNCHIAIGSLGIHRIGLKYASTLKVREYTSRGIPFIISYIDEDLDDNFPFYLKVPDNDDPIDMNLVLEFTENIYKSYVDFSQIMRKYAIEKMDYKNKSLSLLKFIFELEKENFYGN
jgi:hypothetical protein